MSDRQKVLLIEDNPGDVRLIREMLAEGEDHLFQLDCVGRLSQGLEYLATRDAGVVLLDLSLPDSYGFDTFLKVYAHSPKVPIIVLTGHDDQTVALSAVKTGAQDFLVKGKLDRELLLRSMQYSIERKRYQEQLEYQANYDALTGLPNRNLLRDRLKQSVYAQRFARSIGVVFLDIDHFKFVNDSLGHNTGDKLLKKVAERLTETVRDCDTVARLGGDEFILILNDQSGDVIYRAMQRIIGRVAEPIEIEGQELLVTASAGISLYPQDGPDVETLLKNADAAMYRAKEKGRNNFQFYTAEMNRQVNERLKMETSLRRALERKEFEVYYQPRINVESGALVGCEALLRWQHPDLGLTLPERFIGLAEETGLIVPIGEWVLRAACAQAQAWKKGRTSPIAVSVNLSMRQFRQEALAGAIDDALRQSGLDPHLLEMELTESLVMQDTEGAIRVLGRLREIGVALSVDDFGTGHSSLSYLTRLPISALKIDQSFVQHIKGTGMPDEGVVAQAIISLGHNLKLKVVGEGVETDAQFEFLKKHDCDEVQGFHFGKPMPAPEFERFAARSERARS